MKWIKVDYMYVIHALIIASCLAVGYGVGLRHNYPAPPDAPALSYYDGLKFGMEKQREFDALCLFGNPTPEQIDSAATAMCDLLKDEVK